MVAVFRPRQWLTPETVEDAVGMAAEFPDALPFAGGTWIHELKERGCLDRVEIVLDLGRLNLRYVRRTSSGITIGALTTLNDLVASEVLYAQPFAALIQAAFAMGPEQIKNAATIGGAMACGVAVIDLVPALAVLGATVAVIGPRRTREVGVLELVSGVNGERLQPGELVTEVILPNPDPGDRACFRKFRRSASDWPLANAAARIRADNKGHCVDAWLVFGARSDGYFRLKTAEASLSNRVVDGDLLRVLGEQAPGDVVVRDDAFAGADYKRWLAGALITDVVRGAVEAT